MLCPAVLRQPLRTQSSPGQSEEVIAISPSLTVTVL